MKKILFITIFIFPFLLLFHPSIAEAANRYVRTGATGINNGADWTNAYTSLPATLVRGDTYHIADGSYGYHDFTTPVNGTAYIYIKKATLADHGTSTGWQSSYGDGNATFTGWYMWTSYWDIDGQVGQYADDMPDYVPYGFIVARSSTANNQNLIRAGAVEAKVSNISVQHVNAYWTNTTTWYLDCADVYIYGVASANITLKYNWFHRAGGNVIYLLTGTGYVIDHNVLEENCTAGAFGVDAHCIIMKFNNWVGSSQFSNNIVRRWRSTGAVGLYGQNDNIDIFGNLFYCDASGGTAQGTSGFCNTQNNGIINGMGLQIGFEGESYDHIHIYNNTFTDLGTTARFLSIGEWLTDNLMINNIFYNVPNLSTGWVSKSYNWYYNSGSQSETGVQIGTGDPFVNSANKDYRLSAATNAGTILGLPYNIDPLGITRGIDGIWDRGAYEYISSPPPTYQCSDGIDNDNDGLKDYPVDPGCSSATDNDEYNAPVIPPITGNLIQNDTFESFTNGTANNWTAQGGGATYTLSQDTGYAGQSQKISLTAPGGWGMFYYQKPTLTVGKTYTWTFWYKTGGVNTLSAQVVNAPNTSVVLSQSLPATNNVWQKFEKTFTYTDSLADMVRVIASEAGSYWLDDMTLVEGGTVVPPVPDTTPPSAPQNLSVN